MSFEATRFSENGLQLLAQLTTSKTLKIKHVYLDSVEHDIIDLEQPPSWWANTTSATMALVDPEVILAGAIDTQARIRVKLSLKSGITATQTIKTIVICGCAVESGAEGAEITFCGVIDPVGVEVIYHSGSIKTSTGVSIYFNFSNSSSITVETLENPDLVTASDLDRYLTCHKVSDAYEGELQEIYGAKFFKNLVADLYSGIQFGEGAEDVYFSISSDDYENMCFNTHYAGTQGSISNVYKFKNNNLDIVKIDLDRTGNNDIYATTFRGIIKAGEVIANVLNSEDEFIRVSSDIIPKEGGNGYSIGTENNYFNNVYAYNFNGETLKSSIQTDSDRIETVVADGLTFNEYVGSARNWWAKVKYNNISGPGAALITSVKNVDCIVVNENYTTFYNDIIVKKSIKFDSNIILYEDESALTISPGSNGMFVQGNLSVQGSIMGKLPTTDLDPTPRIPVGAVVCLKDLPTNKGVGSVMQGVYTLCGLTGENDPQNHKTKADEEYTLLTSTSSTVTYALAMRIS